VAYQFDSVNGAADDEQQDLRPRPPTWGYTGEIRADSSGSFVYTLGQPGQPGTPFLVTGYIIDQSNGGLNPVPNAPYPTYQNNNTSALVVTQ